MFHKMVFLLLSWLVTITLMTQHTHALMTQHTHSLFPISSYHFSLVMAGSEDGNSEDRNSEVQITEIVKQSEVQSEVNSGKDAHSDTSRNMEEVTQSDHQHEPGECGNIHCTATNIFPDPCNECPG